MFDIDVSDWIYYFAFGFDFGIPSLLQLAITAAIKNGTEYTEIKRYIDPDCE